MERGQCACCLRRCRPWGLAMAASRPRRCRRWKRRCRDHNRLVSRRSIARGRAVARARRGEGGDPARRARCRHRSAGVVAAVRRGRRGAGNRQSRQPRPAARRSVASALRRRARLPDWRRCRGCRRPRHPHAALGKRISAAASGGRGGAPQRVSRAAQWACGAGVRWGWRPRATRGPLGRFHADRVGRSRAADARRVAGSPLS